MPVSSPTTSAGVGPAGSPLIVAHRAGNRLDALRASEGAGVHIVEADVRLFRGRLEVRHLKTLGPLPVLWDRWELAASWKPRLRLGDLLAATSPTTDLMLDLKGRRSRLAELVAEALEPHVETRRFIVSARCWRLLDRFADLPVRRLHSVGNARQLRRLLGRSRTTPLDGISIHERLLDGHVVADLRHAAALLMTWPVNDARRGAELVRLGVDGLISDRPGALAGLGVAMDVA